MKYILALIDEINPVELELFNSKEELLNYLTSGENYEWKLIKTIDWNNLDKYTDSFGEYVAYREDLLDCRVEAYLRVVKD